MGEGNQTTAKTFSSHPAPVAIIGGIAGALAGIHLYLRLPQNEKWYANVLIGMFLLLFAAGAASLYEVKFLQKPFARLQIEIEKTGLQPLQGIYTLLAVMAGFTAMIATGTDNFIARDFWVMLVSWLLGIGLVVIGTWKSGEALPRLSQKTWMLVGAFFLVSFILRVIAADSIPPVLNGDEGSAGLSALRFIEDGINNIFGVGWFSFPALYYALQSIFIRIFGQTTFALRFSSALIGGLTVPVVYLVGRRIYNHRTGLLAAIFIAGSHFHQHFSRIGLNNIWDAFWYIVVLGMLVIGWRTQKRYAFIIAGLSLGFAQFFYVSSRFLLVLVPIWILLSAIFDRSNWKGNRFNILLMFLVFLVVSMPSIWIYAHDPGLNNFMAPFNRVDVMGEWLQNEVEILGKPSWQILAKQIYNSARVFVSLPTGSFYPSGVPVLRPMAAILFIGGLILLLFRLTKPASLMVFLWLGVFVAVGGFSIPIGAAQRYVAALPALALVIGYGLDEGSRIISQVWRGREKWMTAVVILLVAWTAVSNTYFYFFEFTPRSDLGGANTLVAQKLADFLQEQEPLQVAFFGGTRMGYYSISSTAFLAPHIEGLDFWEPWGFEENPPLTSERVAFVFLPEMYDNLKLVQQDFPEGILKVEYDKQENPLYYLYLAENPNAP